MSHRPIDSLEDNPTQAQRQPPVETAACAGESWLTGGGEMGARIRAFDWAGTSLGPLKDWPLNLRVAVDLCLNSRYQSHVWWGPDLVYLYNDAHIPVLGKRHPAALGRSAPKVWTDIWPFLAPQVEGVMRRGESTWNERVHVAVERNGFREDAWFTWSYSPIRGLQGGTDGLLCVGMEETQRVLVDVGNGIRLAGTPGAWPSIRLPISPTFLTWRLPLSIHQQAAIAGSLGS